MESTKNFDQRLRNLLIISGVRREDLACHLGVPVPVLNRWLNGASAPDVYQFQTIANHFGLPYGWFLDGSDGFPCAVKVAEKLGLSPDTVEAPRELAGSGQESVLAAVDDAVCAVIGAACAAYGDEALFLVGGITYLHVQTSEDDRDYTREDCYATYGYTLYDRETMRQLDGGRMEVAADIRDAPEQVHRLAAQNILECRTVLGGSPLELVPLDILETVQGAALREMEERTAPKPSLRDNLKQCQQEAADRSQGGGSPGRHKPEKGR